jgi:serine/threonine-protein kinase
MDPHSTSRAQGAPGAGKPFGPYVLVEKLTEGSMAEVFLAKRKGPSGAIHDVVIKRMLPHLSDIPDFVAMFVDEARLAARFSHPSVIHIIELGQEDGCYYICMEYVPGEDFSNVLRTAARARQFVPFQVCAQVILDAALGLHYAHEFRDDDGTPLNVVHRDISPSNLYVTYDGQVKVLDFGIAKANQRLSAATQVGVVKGKYMYMAPEQARGEPVDRRADIFSLGVSLYEAVTLTRPFARKSDLAVVNAVLKNDVAEPKTLRPDLPEALEQIIHKAMAPKLSERYVTAAQMAEDLTAFLGPVAPFSRTLVASYLSGLLGDERKNRRTYVAAPSSGPPAVQAKQEAPAKAREQAEEPAPTIIDEAEVTENDGRVSPRGARTWALGAAVALAGAALLWALLWRH